MSTRAGDLVVSLEMRKQLLALGTLVTKAKGTILFRHGDPVLGLFLICKGKIRLALDSSSLVFPPRILGPDSVAGLPASVAGSPYSLTAEVVENAELLFVPRGALVNCLQQNPEFCFEVMDILSAEISGTRAALKHSSSRSHRD
ncbi:MAG: cyclic nucleotide-binding domain-containing protein [Terriglobales bacterium]|jgi:CRP-like cAMP-binding protein